MSYDLSDLFAPMEKICREMFAKNGNKVLTGPFKGMQIPCKPIWDDGNTVHKLIGGYERELHGAVEKAISRKPDIIVNVGSAEGYYAIGLAMRLPEAAVYAVDLDERSLGLLWLYANKNALQSRISLLGEIRDPNHLDIGLGHHLYVSDCEGSELDLFDPELCPRLKSSDLIIECHDFLRPECSSTLIDRFSATHEIEVIKDQPPHLLGAFDKQPMLIRVLLATDIRPAGGCWLALWAKNPCF